MSAVSGCAQGADPVAAIAALGAIACWPCDEQAGADRVDRIGGRRLREGAGAMAREPGGRWGRHALRVEPGQWLACPRSELGPLDLHGRAARLTLAAWVLRRHPEPWQFVAGVWDESHERRQYGLFLNARARSLHPLLQREACHDRVHGHISASGGKTPGREAWVHYASGGSELPLGRWTLLALRYDGQAITVWRDGHLDPEPGSNPMPYPKGIACFGADGAPFTVGANHVRGGMTNRFGGLIGGIAVFARALDADELRRLATLRMD